MCKYVHHQIRLYFSSHGWNAVHLVLQDIIEKLMQSMDISAISTELIIRILGLTNCADTPLGNEMIRGVSGGERKRVTLGEMLVGNKVRSCFILT